MVYRLTFVYSSILEDEFFDKLKTITARHLLKTRKQGIVTEKVLLICVTLIGSVVILLLAVMILNLCVMICESAIPILLVVFALVIFFLKGKEIGGLRGLV